MKLTEDLAEFVGICIGDGCISVNKRYSELSVCGDIVEEKEYYLKRVIPLFNKELCKPLIGKEVIGKEYLKNGVYGFKIFNKIIVKYLEKLGLNSGRKINVTIPEKFVNKELVKAVLRGIFDTDGTVYFNKSTSGIYSQPRIKLGSTSKKLIFQLKEIIKSLGITSYIKKPYKGKRDTNKIYSIVIYRKEDILKWSKEIGFNNPKHSSKIKIWKNLGKGIPHSTLKERKEILSKLV